MRSGLLTAQILKSEEKFFVSVSARRPPFKEDIRNLYIIEAESVISLSYINLGSSTQLMTASKTQPALTQAQLLVAAVAALQR
jgi:hypothetical protein